MNHDSDLELERFEKIRFHNNMHTYIIHNVSCHQHAADDDACDA